MGQRDFNDLTKFFDKKTYGGAATLARSENLATRDKSAVKNENMSNKELVEELHKPIKTLQLFIVNIWIADLADMQQINKYNKGRRFLCVIDIFSKYAWVIHLKDREGITIANAFQNQF